MRSIKPLKKIALVLLVIVLLPALIFTARELSTLNESEQLISEIYRRQLDAILFSLNQYAWDTANGWVSRLHRIDQSPSATDVSHILSQFLTENRSLGVAAVFFADRAGGLLQVQMAPGSHQNAADLTTRLSAALKAQPNILRQLQQYQKSGYRKIEPLPLRETDTSVLLLFPLAARSATGSEFAGILLEPETFIRSVLFPRLQEMAGERFQIAVVHGERQFSYNPDIRLSAAGISEKKAVWLFPHYFLAIRPHGGTIEEIAASRFRQNLLLIFILTALIIGAVWFVYRSVQREMQLAQLKSDFVSNISHELRTPLALIRMFAETLSLGRVRSEARRKEYYQIIEQESERLTHLINKILNFSRIEAGRKTYQYQSVQLNTVAEDVLQRYRIHLQQHGFHLETALAADLPPVWADPEAVTEALLNLMDNSIKYSEKERWLMVASGQTGQGVFLEVRDRGIGIHPSDHEKIFEKFHRVAPAGSEPGTLAPHTKGSGLGLALVKHIMEAHGGRVLVASTPGNGASFRLIFPRPNPDGEAAASQVKEFPTNPDGTPSSPKTL